MDEPKTRRKHRKREMPDHELLLEVAEMARYLSVEQHKFISSVNLCPKVNKTSTSDIVKQISANISIIPPNDASKLEIDISDLVGLTLDEAAARLGMKGTTLTVLLKSHNGRTNWPRRRLKRIGSKIDMLNRKFGFGHSFHNMQQTNAKLKKLINKREKLSLLKVAVSKSKIDSYPILKERLNRERTTN